MPIDYSKGKIYKIVDLDSNECYIGSTCEPTLAKRLAKHVSGYKSYLKDKSNYVTSFKIIQNDDYDIVLIENYPCNSKDELHARESYYSQNMDCVNKVKHQGLMNMIGKVEYNKQHYEANKKQIIEKNKQYCEQHKDQIKQYREQQYEQHKDQILEQNKQYYKANKEQIIEKKNQKHNCECGGCYTSTNKRQHFKTSKHINNI
jgi:hypothetical protein